MGGEGSGREWKGRGGEVTGKEGKERKEIPFGTQGDIKVKRPVKTEQTAVLLCYATDEPSGVGLYWWQILSLCSKKC